MNFAAIITAYLPCVTFGQIAEVLDEGEMSKSSTQNFCQHMTSHKIQINWTLS